MSLGGLEIYSELAKKKDSTPYETDARCVAIHLADSSLFCGSVPVSPPVMIVNRVSGESPEESYSRACSQLLMVGFEAVSPWRSWLSSSMVLSALVEPPAVSDCSSCPLPHLWTELDCHRRLPSTSTRSLMFVLPKGKSYFVCLLCGRGNRSDILLPELVRTIHVIFCEHNGQSRQLLTTQCVDLQKQFPASLADFILRVKGHCPESLQDRRSVLSLSYWSALTILIRRPKLSNSSSRQCSVPIPYMRFLKLTSFSLLNLSFFDKFVQNSSRRGRERSISTSSFSKERNYPLISLCLRGDSLPELKTGKSYQFPSHLLSYVKVRLEPVDATIHIVMRVEVLDGVATSHVIVTNRSLLAEFEERCKSFIDWIVSGIFDFLLKALSNFLKFVSLSLYFIECYALDLAFSLAHLLICDDATSFVIP
ncbi:hypothetical protein Bca4012_078280 [Brassica carinata]|uniref:Uncharacterized protein n=1 Tax=Brassica carinata TaxID=52824 RepID=A0A8X7U4Z1_BRACI|nr:hypothetical protein Bca52824_071635 [Brassica carinata]